MALPFKNYTILICSFHDFSNIFRAIKFPNECMSLIYCLEAKRYIVVILLKFWVNTWIRHYDKEATLITSSLTIISVCKVKVVLEIQWIVEQMICAQKMTEML